MNAAIPGHIYESEEIYVLACRHPAKTVHPDLADPVNRQHPVAERLGMQRVQLLVLEFPSPAEILLCHVIPPVHYVRGWHVGVAEATGASPS